MTAKNESLTDKVHKLHSVMEATKKLNPLVKMKYAEQIADLSFNIIADLSEQLIQTKGRLELLQSQVDAGSMV